MPVPSDTKYPAVATNAAWQKKKSILDKGIKTKVGPALVLAEQKWKAIDFDDLKTNTVHKRLGAAKEALKKAKVAYKASTDARAAVQAAHKLATTQSNNTKLNSASRTALKTIATALKGADDRLGQLDDVIPALMVDVNNATQTAMATLKNLEVKDGSRILAHAKSAKLASNKTYEVKDITWRIPDQMLLSLLQKKVKVSAHDGFGELINLDMTIDGLSGSDMMRLK
jgi:hypothetical protein